MDSILVEYIYLVFIILALVMISNKLRIAYPIILVIGGLVLSIVDIFSHITIDPQLIFFIFLPPLLYEAAWQVSWKELWKWRRVIISFAFPIVIITSCVIAFVSWSLIPGFTLALGFLLGGIISPPDAISATSIMRRVNVPKGLLSIAEGESLLNDASSLIIFRFALAAVITGQFFIEQAAVSFFLVVFMGTLIGLATGLIFYAIHRWLPVTPSIEIVLTLLAPYCMYYFAEYFHFSGVLAVVSGGLFLSSRRMSMLSYQSRIQGLNVWSVLGFLLNGIIFLLIGLQLPFIVRQLGNISIISAVWYGLVISIVLIITRLLCTLGASLFTRFMSRFITVADSNPGWRSPLILGWAGMRGVVSLAAAMSIPLFINAGEPFPHRNLILFITFIVILVTLVIQGLTLPWVIRKVKPRSNNLYIPEEEQEKLIQQKIAESSLQFFENKFDTDEPLSGHFINMKEKFKTDINYFNRLTEESYDPKDDTLKLYYEFSLDLLQHQRALLKELNRHPDYDEEIIRKYFAFIDLEELKIHQKLMDENDS